MAAGLTVCPNYSLWFSTLGDVLFTHSALRGFIWNQEFSSHRFRHKIPEFFGISSFYRTGNYLIVPAAMLLLAALRASFCAHHLVQVFTHRLNPRGLHKCINIAQISSALYMQNTFIVLSPNTLFSHKIVLSAGRTRQMNLLTNDLRMKWYLMNCGLYTKFSIKNTREASVYWKSKGNVNTSETYTEHTLIQLSWFWRREETTTGAFGKSPINVCHWWWSGAEHK